MKKLELLCSASVVGKKRVLVTGGSGFIGCNVVEKLAKLGHDVIIYDRVPPKKWAIDLDNQDHLPGNISYRGGDTRNREDVFDAVMNSDYTLHLAGLLGTHETMFAISETTECNVMGSLNVFEAIRMSGKKAAYITLGNDWENPYTISKTCSARYALMFNREFNTKISVIRGLNVYGPKQKLFPIQKAIPTFIYKAIVGEDIPVFGDGQQIIDLVWIGDTSETLIRSLFMDIEKQYATIIDAGTGVETKLNDIVHSIIEMVGETEFNKGELSKIDYMPMRRGEPIRSRTLGNISSLTELIDFVPAKDLNKGMKETIDWYMEYREILMKDKTS
jgi:UDP-glucose 4-epimerase